MNQDGLLLVCELVRAGAARQCEDVSIPKALAISEALSNSTIEILSMATRRPYRFRRFCKDLI